METNTNKDGLQRCPHCQKEFKQLSRHMPSCKKRQDNEAGIHSIKAGHPTETKPSAGAERQDPGSANGLEKPREICDGCRETFICLQKHKPHCKGVKQKAIDRQSPPCKSKLQSPLTSAKKNIIKNSSAADIVIPDDCSGSMHLNSASTLETQESEEKGNEICSNCGKTFKCLAKHIRWCNVLNRIKDANDINECRITTNIIDDLDIKRNENTSLPHVTSHIKMSKAENERERRSMVNGSRSLKLEDSEPSLQRPHLEGAPAVEQNKPKVSCPYCGENFVKLPLHVRACKKRTDHASAPTSLSENDTLSDSSKQTQQPHIQLQLSGQKEHISHLSSGQKEHILERQNSVVDLPETASLANKTYSEDPKAELDKLQKENKIDKVEINAANKVVEEMRVCFLQKLNSLSNFKWSIVLAGSYSDETKIKSANEFDFIICIDIKCRAECLEVPNKLGYCLVVPSPERNVRQDISSLMKGEYLDPRLIKDMAFELFNKVIEDPGFRKGRRIKRLHRKPGSPAFTIAYNTGGGNEYEIDLVPAIRFDGWPQISAMRDWQPKWWPKHDIGNLKKDYFAVTREHPYAKQVHGELLWRLSFTNTERKLWSSVDSSKRTCRKEILKDLKAILEDCKDANTSVMPNLSSFHLRTFMLHQYDERPDEKDWLVKDRRTCLHVCIDNLQERLKDKVMNNYYVNGHNVLDIMEHKEIQVFLKALSEAKTRF